MTPFFNPGPNRYGAPKVFLAGVGAKMTEVAGEVADGFLCHGFTTERYVKEITIPRSEKGRAKAGKTLDGFEIAGPIFVVTGETEDEVKAADTMVRAQIAFYGSTPAYRSRARAARMGRAAGRAQPAVEAGPLARHGRLIDDDMLDTFAVVGEPDEVAPELLRRFGGAVTRLSFYMPGAAQAARWTPIVRALQAA